MKVDMMGVPQSRWGYSEVFDVHTYVPPKTQVAMMRSRLSFGSTPLREKEGPAVPVPAGPAALPAGDCR